MSSADQFSQTGDSVRMSSYPRDVAVIHRVNDERSAKALADHLNGNRRSRPVVVITVPADRDQPWVDAEEVARETGDLAEVHLMATGTFTWEFSRHMADGTQVYGGAARVYPVGHEWIADLTRSPLRFAFDASDGEQVTQRIISDALRMAVSAGLVRTRPTQDLQHTAGVVKMIVAGRALVDIDRPLPAAIAEELTIEDVPIQHLVVEGQRLEGWHDHKTNRLDITGSLRSPADALASYDVDDVVLTRVATVRNGKAELVLYPKTSEPAVSVVVLRADVTTNPADDLRTLLTVGEVVAARIVRTGPDWALALHDVDADADVVAPPAVLTGGPPWLVEEDEDADASDPPADSTLPQPTSAPAPATQLAPIAESPSSEETPPPPRPTPTLLDRNRRTSPRRPEHAEADPIPPVTTREHLLKIDALTAQVAGLQRDNDQLNTQLRAGSDERSQLRYLLDQAERRANKAEHDVRAARSRLRKAGNTKHKTLGGDGPRFADAEQGFRHLVVTQWATRTLPDEQVGRPLPPYVIGTDFLDTLDTLEGIKAEKVADVVVEILTGLAPQIASRQVHRLRVGPGGDDPVRVRGDGAVAWRASLQVNAPSARRIHYWARPDGQIELARVATHDDFEA